MRLFSALLIPLFMATAGLAANTGSNFGGVGIDGAPRADGEIIVRQLVAGGPAAVAGIQTGDIITQIDGKATRGSDFKKLVDQRLRGQAGTPVVLTIHRPGENGFRKVTLTRRQLVVEPKGKPNSKGAKP